MANDYRKIMMDGLWSNNSILVQVLGLCPLLATSSTFINALGLGVATTAVLVGSNVTVSLIRNYVKAELRIAVFVMVIASCVTIVQLAMNAWVHELYKILGIFIPLIVTNCVIIARAESFASKNNVPSSALDGLSMGLGFTLILLILGSTREILGQGPLASKVTDFTPASSPSWRSIISVLKFLVSAYRRYMRKRISHQSWASVPPAPA